VGRTFLYIRKYAGDVGNEPRPAGIPGWMCPDLLVEKPDGTLGCEAVADQQNQVHLTVNNDGGMDARDVYLEVFIADPTTSFTPAAATRVGSGFFTIPGYSRATAVFPWVPSGAEAGHRCLAARASLLHPPDTYRDGWVFDAWGDRHVAQRNIHILPAPAAGAQIVFPFQVGNPGATALATRVLAREVRAPEQAEALRTALGSPFVQFAERPLGGLALALVDTPRERPQRLAAVAPPDAEESARPATGVRAFIETILRLLGMRGGKDAPPTAPPALSLRLEPGKGVPAVLRVAHTPTARPGEVHAIEVVQYDERERMIGGLTVVIRH
jgi:hypothetical protein